MAFLCYNNFICFLNLWRQFRCPEGKCNAIRAQNDWSMAMKITYIHHSAFLAETESACLLFDYFKGTLPEIPVEKPLYVFASHRHGDHFSEDVFEVAKEHENTWFLLSSDIWTKRVPVPLRDRTISLAPNQTWNDACLRVETFRSTDEGVAFWCSVDGKEIYHAGDLNHWYWDGEDEAWNRDMTKKYRTEIEKMRGRRADVAFLPLDPRLEEWFYLGIDDFMKVVDVKTVFPMHFWEQFDVAARLKALPVSESYRDRIVEINEAGQAFVI